MDAGSYSKESIHTVLETMKKVISEPTATGYGLHREEYTLAGKQERQK